MPPAPSEPVNASAAHAGSGSGGGGGPGATSPGMDTSPVMGLVDERAAVAAGGAAAAAPRAHAPYCGPPADDDAGPEPGPPADSNASLAPGCGADAAASPTLGLTRGAAAAQDPAAVATPASAAGTWRALASPAGADAGPAPLVRGLALALGAPAGTPGSSAGGASPEPAALDAIAQVRAQTARSGTLWASVMEPGGTSTE